jgi:hypothetical protein
MTRRQEIPIDDPEDERIWQGIMARVNPDGTATDGTVPPLPPSVAGRRGARTSTGRAAQAGPWGPAWLHDAATLDQLVADQEAWLETLEKNGRGHWYRWLCSFPAPTATNQDPPFFRLTFLPPEDESAGESPHETLLKSAGWLEGVPADFSMEPEEVASVVRDDPSWAVWQYAKPYLEHYYDGFDLDRLKRFITALDRRPEGQPSPYQSTMIGHVFHRLLARARLVQRYYLCDPGLELAPGVGRWNRDEPPPPDALPVLAAREYQVDGRPLTIDMRAWPRGAAIVLLSRLLGIAERTLASHLTKQRENSRSTLPKT